jgi:phosphoribosylaminoimidazole-succinocarboxamide synthase
MDYDDLGYLSKEKPLKVFTFCAVVDKILRLKTYWGEKMIVEQTELEGLKLHSRGKVRDIYDLDDSLLIISTDRISAFDFILPNAIPDKGKVLNQLSLFWFHLTEGIVDNHILTADVKDYPDALKKHADVLEGRSMIVKKAKMIDVECVARGYLAGSGWKDYKKTGFVTGIKLPAGLKESSKLPEPIFSPATKAMSGHDINISLSEVERIVGKDTASKLKDLTLTLYQFAADYAEKRGIIIADTKFELGYHDDKLIIADEMLTPDSSRFWPGDTYQPGKSQPSFDKQFVRDYLESIHWSKEPPVPELPEDIIQETRQKYLEIFRILTGETLH